MPNGENIAELSWTREDGVIYILQMWHFDFVFPTTVGSRISVSTALEIKRLSPSAAMRNKKGDRESPCQRPLSSLKSLVGAYIHEYRGWCRRHTLFHPLPPFSVEVHLHHHFLKIVPINSSYAFSKSTLKKIFWSFFFFASSIISLRTTIPSKFCLPRKKADWFSNIIRSNTLLSLMARVLYYKNITFLWRKFLSL